MPLMTLTAMFAAADCGRIVMPNEPNPGGPLWLQAAGAVQGRVAPYVAAANVRRVLGYLLPLLGLGALALFSWWLVQSAPSDATPRRKSVLQAGPDYSLERVIAQRYNAQGSLIYQVEGEQMRHLPEADELHIDRVALTALAPDGRSTRAKALRAVVRDDRDEIRLEGGAHVLSHLANEPDIELSGEQLIARMQQRTLESQRPVRVVQGGSEFSADGLQYDQQRKVLVLQGHVRATLMPRRGSP